MRLQLVPPKPKELLMVQANSAFRISRTTGRSATMGSGSSRLMLGAMKFSCIIRMQKMASKAPAAPSAWPVMDLVEENGGTFEPNTVRMASISRRSPAGVEVPCRLM
jgi:hypothetical protein